MLNKTSNLRNMSFTKKMYDIYFRYLKDGNAHDNFDDF